MRSHVSEETFVKSYLELLRRYREKGLLFDVWNKPLRFSHPLFSEYITWFLFVFLLLYFGNNSRMYSGIFAIIFSLPLFIMVGWKNFLLGNLKSDLDERIESLGIRRLNLGNLSSISQDIMNRINSLEINISSLKTIDPKGMDEDLFIVFGAKGYKFLKTGFGSVGYVNTSEYFTWRFNFREKVLNETLWIDNWSSPKWSNYSSITKEKKLFTHEKEIINLACILNGYRYQNFHHDPCK